MSGLITQPENTNFLQTTKFILTFPRISNTQYFCQQVNMPGVSLTELPQQTPFIELYKPGNKMQYELFNVTFIVDEELRAWIQLHDWIKALTFPNDFDQYKNLKNLSPVATGPSPQYADGTLTIISSLNNPKISLQFVDMFPTTLSSIMFNTTDENTTTITADCSFRFSYFNVTRY